MRAPLLMGLLAAALVSAERPSHAQSYVARILNPPGFDLTYAQGVNGSHQVGFGHGAATGGVKYHALMLQSNAASMVDLHPSGYSESRLYAISGNQQAGYVVVSLAAGRAQAHAYLWSGSAIGGVDLHPTGYDNTIVFAASGGMQGGRGFLAGNTNSRALLWTGSPESVVDLHPSGYDQSEVLGVSATEQVGRAWGVSTNGVFHAVRWSGSAASAVDLNPSWASGSTATGASGGQQAGHAFGSVTGSQWHAMLWSGTAASATDINPSGYSGSQVWAVSGSRQVGQAWTQPIAHHAFVWSGTAASGVDLHAYLPATYTRSIGLGIDESGNVAGVAIDAAGLTHAVVWLVAGNGTVTAAAPASGRIGQAVELSATLTRQSDATAISGETLVFEVDGAAAGSATTDAGGIARTSYRIPEAGGPGQRTITVRYAGGPSFGSSSAIGALSVSKGRPAFSLYAAVGAPGQSTTLRTLFLCGGQPVLGRAVAFSVDGLPVGSAVSNGQGAALAYRIPITAAGGWHTVSVAFAGDSAYTPAARTTAALWVRARVGFSLYPAEGVSGRSVVLRTLVYALGSPLAGIPVAFAVDGVPIGVAVSDATGAAALFSIPPGMTPGVHDVTATFAGNAMYFPASRTTAALTVKAPVLFSLHSVTGAPGQTVTLRTLVYSGGAPVAGLPILFAVDGTPVGSAVSTPSGAGVQYAIPASTGAGLHAVTVTFPGNATYAASSRTTAALTVR